MPRWFLSIEEMQSEKRYPDIPKDIWRSKHPAGPLVEMTLVSKRQVRAPTNKTRQKHTKTTNLSKRELGLLTNFGVYHSGTPSPASTSGRSFNLVLAVAKFAAQNTNSLNHGCRSERLKPVRTEKNNGWSSGYNIQKKRNSGKIKRLPFDPTLVFFLLSFIKLILFFSNVFPLAKWQHGILHGWYSIHHQSQQKYAVALMINDICWHYWWFVSHRIIDPDIFFPEASGPSKFNVMSLQRTPAAQSWKILWLNLVCILVPEKVAKCHPYWEKTIAPFKS